MGGMARAATRRVLPDQQPPRRTTTWSERPTTWTCARRSTWRRCMEIGSCGGEGHDGGMKAEFIHFDEEVRRLVETYDPLQPAFSAARGSVGSGESPEERDEAEGRPWLESA